MIKWDKVLHETYELLFKASEPSVDFNNLVENASINERGEKEIPFMDYEIDEDVMSGIMESQVKKYKMKPYDKRGFNIAIYLGCSPKTKYKKLSSSKFKDGIIDNI